MSIFPEYQDVSSQFQIRKGGFPFYIFFYPSRDVGLHYHDFAELAFVVEGSGSQTVNGVSHRLQPGSMSVLLPMHLHATTCDDAGAGIRKFSCMFDIHILSGSSGDAELYELLLGAGTEFPSCCALEPEQAERARLVMEELYAECRAPGIVGHRSFVRTKLIEVLLLYVRAAIGAHQRQRQLNTAGDGEAAARASFWSILSHIHVHYQQPMTLQQLAGQFGVSVPHITRSFKQYKGISFLEYIHGLRLNNAAVLLLSTDMAIVDIALEAGFESFRTFSRVFRESYGLTPSTFRANGGVPARHADAGEQTGANSGGAATAPAPEPTAAK